VYAAILGILSQHVFWIIHVVYDQFLRRFIISSPGRRPWKLMAWRSVCPSSVRRQLFPLNDFSKTTRPISTKLERKHAWGMGIQICSKKGAGPFWGLIRGKIRKILINLQKSSSHEPVAGMHWYIAWSILGARRFKLFK